MKDLQIDNSGDLVISKHDIQLVRDKELTAQKVRLTLSTNKGEWSLNEDEGINFKAFLTKNPNQDEILDTVLDGLHQIDETMKIDSYDFKIVNRNLTMQFKASTPSGESMTYTVEGSQGSSDNDNWIVRALADLVEVEE